jgi:hypothetical protein
VSTLWVQDQDVANASPVPKALCTNWIQSMSQEPIQDFDAIDIVGEKEDGTVDLVIVVSSYLNDSESHQEMLKGKIQAYVTTIFSNEWQSKYGEGNSNILIKAVEVPDQEIINLIGALKTYLADYNVNLSLEIA